MIPVTDLDIIFLSYDEPLAEPFFRRLQSQHPKVRHLKGVKGLDRVYTAAADMAETDHVITIDGDTLVDPAFFGLALDPELLRPGIVLSWPGKNATNGLCYGNGSIKCWSRRHVLGLPSRAKTGIVDIHDYSRLQGKAHTAFLEMAVPFATSHSNTTPKQAFRSAFREGVRLYRSVLHSPANNVNNRRLAIWLSVGRDAQNGAWSLYGARLGAYLTAAGRLKVTNINDYDWFDEYWSRQIERRFAGDGAICAISSFAWSPERLETGIRELARSLREEIGFNVVELDADQSRTFKQLGRFARPLPADRLGRMWRDGDGVDPDHALARTLFESGALTGEGNAMVNLARALRLGELGPRDYRRAAELLREAAGLGNRFAAARLGDLECEGYGWGVERTAHSAQQATPT